MQSNRNDRWDKSDSNTSIRWNVEMGEYIDSRVGLKGTAPRFQAIAVTPLHRDETMAAERTGRHVAVANCIGRGSKMVAHTRRPLVPRAQRVCACLALRQPCHRPDASWSLLLCLYVFLSLCSSLPSTVLISSTRSPTRAPLLPVSSALSLSLSRLIDGSLERHPEPCGATRRHGDVGLCMADALLPPCSGVVL